MKVVTVTLSYREGYINNYATVSILSIFSRVLGKPMPCRLIKLFVEIGKHFTKRDLKVVNRNASTTKKK